MVEPNWARLREFAAKHAEGHEAGQRLREALPPVAVGCRVLLAERSPKAFLAAFCAALELGAEVFVADCGWNAAQWAEALPLARPQAVSLGGLDEATAALVVGWLERQRVSVTLPPFRPVAELAALATVAVPTGGSGGRVKFARHRWATLAAAAQGFAAHFGAPKVRSLCVLPLWHVSGLMQAVRAAETGGRVAFADWARLKEGRFPASPQPSGWFLSLVPTQLARLLELPGGADWLRGFAAVPLGGAACPPELLARARAERLPLAPSYGMTETAAMAAATLPAEFLAGADDAGRPLPHARVEAVDDSGRPLPPGGEGLLRVGGASLFLGYAGGPPVERTAGWLTADRGVLDAAGRVRVVGRADRLVVTGGEKVDPAVVEEALRRLPGAREVLAYGVPDTHWGEALHAAVAGPEDAAALAAILARLPPPFRPKRVRWLPEIPRTAAGKPDWPKLHS